MSKILSQEEIDALLQSARRFGGGRTRLKNDPASRATRYDFQRQPECVSPDLLSAMEGIHEQFALSLSSSLTMRLRTAAEISVESVRTQSYSEFVYSLSDPTSIITTSMKPLDGITVLEFNPSVVFPTIDILLGGPGIMPNVVRPISEIEWSIFEGITSVLTEDLRQAWMTMVPGIKFEISSRETRPHLVHAAQPQDSVITFTLKVKVGNGEGYMHLNFPTSALKPYMHTLSNTATATHKQPDLQSPLSSSSSMSSGLCDLIRQVNVNLTAELRGTVLTVDELLQLREGDILRLDHRLTMPASISVNNSEKFVGTLGTLEGCRMISVLDGIA